MTQVCHGGWAQAEQEQLWSEVSLAARENRPLRSAFERFAEKSGRRPNSVRNYYYTAIKSGAARPEDAEDVHSFTPFSRDQVESLLDEILASLGRGESVRACVLRMGAGDRSLSLRYQNKYRSILKSHPEWVQASLQRLQSKGIPAVDPFSKMRARRNSPIIGAEADAPSLLDAISRLVDHSETVRRKQREELDRMQVRCDLLRLELARRDEALAETNARFSAAQHALQQAKAVSLLCVDWLEVADEPFPAESSALRNALKALSEACSAL